MGSEFDVEIKNLIQKRNEARQNKNFGLSDQIRDELGMRGFILKDTQAGTVVKEKVSNHSSSFVFSMVTSAVPRDALTPELPTELI
jgi:hypothetical protein